MVGGREGMSAHVTADKNISLVVNKVEHVSLVSLEK